MKVTEKRKIALQINGREAVALEGALREMVHPDGTMRAAALHSLVDEDIKILTELQLALENVIGP